MPTTLTLGGAGFTNTAYNTTQSFTVTDNTVVRDTIVIAGVPDQATFYNGNNSAVLFTDPAATANRVTLDLGTGNDTLTVNTAIVGNKALNANAANQAKLLMGGGNDSLTINSYVERYSLQAGAGNDTVIINEATATPEVDVRNSAINLSTGADYLQIDADLLFVNITAGTTNSEGVDTIVIRDTTSGVTIAGFSISSDEDILILGGQQFSGADYSGGVGTFNSSAHLTGSNDAIDAVNAWLDNGNTLTLI
jgi:hypothetical protein